MMEAPILAENKVNLEPGKRNKTQMWKVKLWEVEFERSQVQVEIVADQIQEEQE